MLMTSNVSLLFDKKTTTYMPEPIPPANPIDIIKQDIVSYKNSSKYKSIHWFNSKTNERENFVKDYMVDREIDSDFEYYNELVYIVMCRGWNMNYVTSSWNQ